MGNISGGHVSSVAHFNGGHSYSGAHYNGNHSFAGVHYSNGLGHINYNHSPGHNHYSYGRYNNGHYNLGHGYYNYGRYNRGWPYRNYAYGNYWRYYRPYVYGLGYFGYPYLSSYYDYPGSYYYNSYPTYYDNYAPDYYANSGDRVVGNSYENIPSPNDNVVANRPAADTARLEIRLPDPQASIWVEGQSIASDGAVRQFNSPQLDPARQFTYDVKAAWIENGKLVTDERRVKVQANAQSVVDFTKSIQSAPEGGTLPSPKPLPPQQRDT
jgi:uncharacterized protein (TIGR03000 family)